MAKERDSETQDQYQQGLGQLGLHDPCLKKEKEKQGREGGKEGKKEQGRKGRPQILKSLLPMLILYTLAHRLPSTQDALLSEPSFQSVPKILSPLPTEEQLSLPILSCYLLR